MPRNHGKRWTVKLPSLADFKGRTLRAYLEALDAWLRKFQGAMQDAPGRRDRYWAKTVGTITANAGVDGPLGFGDVIRLQRQDDRTLDDVGDGEDIEVDNAVMDPIPDGELVLIELVDGVDTITAWVCP